MGATTSLMKKRIPILRLRPRLEVVEGDVGELTAERGAIHRIADAVEPIVHLGGILTHALADDIERDLVIVEGRPVTRERMARASFPVSSSLARSKRLPVKRRGVLKDANGDRPNVRDGNLRERPCRRERCGVDPFSELLFHEIEVLHEGNGRENRCADADFRDVLFDLVLAVEVRNARLPVGGADGSEDEMHACCLGRVGGGNTLSCLGVRASGRHRHREERGRSFERLHNRPQCLRAMPQRAPPRR